MIVCDQCDEELPAKRPLTLDLSDVIFGDDDFPDMSPELHFCDRECLYNFIEERLEE